MNTDKTLNETFYNNYKSEYPVWYYKKLEEIDVDDVIFNLLKCNFVVELNGKKISITFGKNENDEIGTTQFCEEGLDHTSYKTIDKAFREGKWFKVTNRNTSKEFKEEFEKKRSERLKKEHREAMIFMLSRLTKGYKGMTREELEEELSEWTDEDLELCVSKISEKLKKESMNNE